MHIRPALWLAVLSICGVFATLTPAATYQLNNGQTIVGEPIAPDGSGILFKLDATTFSDRIGWTNFTEEALNELAKDPKIKPFTDPYTFDESAFEEERKAALKIEAKTGPKLERPDPEAGWGALFSALLPMMLVLVVYGANVYAGFEIAMFRNYHPLIGCLVAAVVPILGPVIFLCIPTNMRQAYADEEDELAAQEQALAEAAQAEASAVELAAAAAPDVAAETAKKAGPPPPTVYKRGQFTFNRRFFETKFANFLRMVPTEEDKDLVICVESVRGNYVAPRLSKVMQNELCLQVSKGNASSEVTIPFSEIQEVQIRQKEA